MLKNFLEKVKKNGPAGSKTERVTDPSRRTRKEIAKWNQMTALRFQTGGRHQTSPASLQGFDRGEGGPKKEEGVADVRHRRCRGHKHTCSLSPVSDPV